MLAASLCGSGTTDTIKTGGMALTVYLVIAAVAALTGRGDAVRAARAV